MDVGDGRKKLTNSEMKHSLPDRLAAVQAVSIPGNFTKVTI